MFISSEFDNSLRLLDPFSVPTKLFGRQLFQQQTDEHHRLESRCHMEA